ncbi:MAG: T9SS type A sorting domain-containing protein, partial [Candidatus Eisenbacteria bacterium]|nr:T9SS type A sorting domain-containing protein [Candidatus Eisenbacteria bacterium]
IGPSQSTILNLRFVVYPEFEADTITLSLSDVIAAGGNSNEIELMTENGTMTLDRRVGDLTGDNRVDVLDLIFLTEVILGVSELETIELFDLADCNSDNAVNVLDVPCFTDYILDSPSTVEFGVPEFWQVETTVTVRGFQLSTGRGHIYFDHPSFQSHTGTGLGGESILLAYSLDGSSWQPDGLATVAFVGEQPEIRAYGENNELLNVSYKDRVITISARPGKLRLLPPTPNPVRGSATVSFESDVEGPATLEVFDVQGALVRKDDFRAEVGLNQTSWIAKNETGRSLSSGVYFLRLKTQGSEATTRLVVVGE